MEVAEALRQETLATAAAEAAATAHEARQRVTDAPGAAQEPVVPESSEQLPRKSEGASAGALLSAAESEGYELPSNDPTRAHLTSIVFIAP